MSWLKDPAWQEGLAILLVVTSALLIYRGVSVEGELGGVALLGMVLFGIGIALPLISQVLQTHRENKLRSEYV